VDAAIRAPGQVPQKKGVDVAKQDFAGFRPLANALYVFKNPAGG